MKKNIFIFTGGGLAPALNPTLYGAISAAREKGWGIVGGLFGWASLLKNGQHVNLDNLPVEAIRSIGGTFLRSSRTNPLVLADGVNQVKKRLRELNIDAVVAIGGDDTLGAAAELYRKGVPIVGIPKTIDNDLSGTYYTPGFPSAAHYLSTFTKEIKEDAAYALSRIFVIESMGMKAGWLAASSIYGQADIIITPEQSVSLRNMLTKLEKCYRENGNYAIVVVAQETNFDEPLERIMDSYFDEQYGHKRHSFVCVSLREKIKKELGFDTKALYPGNFLETGIPIPQDRDMGISIGRHAIQMLDNGNFGNMATIIRPDDKKKDLILGEISLCAIVGKQNYRIMPPNFFDSNEFKPTTEFFDYMEPMLGSFEEKEDEYTKLIKKITHP